MLYGKAYYKEGDGRNRSNTDMIGEDQDAWDSVFCVMVGKIITVFEM